MVALDIVPGKASSTAASVELCSHMGGWAWHLSPSDWWQEQEGFFVAPDSYSLCHEV